MRVLPVYELERRRGSPHRTMNVCSRVVTRPRKRKELVEVTRRAVPDVLARVQGAGVVPAGALARASKIEWRGLCEQSLLLLVQSLVLLIRVVVLVLVLRWVVGLRIGVINVIQREVVQRLGKVREWLGGSPKTCRKGRNAELDVAPVVLVVSHIVAVYGWEWRVWLRRRRGGHLGGARSREERRKEPGGEDASEAAGEPSTIDGVAEVMTEERQSKIVRAGEER